MISVRRCEKEVGLGFDSGFKETCLLWDPGFRYDLSLQGDSVSVREAPSRSGEVLG